MDITPDARRKQVVYVREPLANSDVWSIGKVNKILQYEQGILVNYRSGYNNNRIIGWQDTGRSIPAHYCKVAILEKNSNMRGWSFPSEWLSSTHRSNTMIPDDMVPTAALNPIISLPLVQDIWIHRWIDDDNLKAQLIDIRNILAERTEIPIEYNLRKFIKTLMNARVAAEWSMLKTNGHEIPIAWNIT
ncbi:hypothetical protein GLOIN_2v1785617 [Rhizophagus irregularis DAOM 181602=DAOM 197198]|nr:hypothetical protein GLOIN_2v1785617 [Rhizophagus irregularis DAOM 181602=DAOM 197198]